MLIYAATVYLTIWHPEIYFFTSKQVFSDLYARIKSDQIEYDGQFITGLIRMNSNEYYAITCCNWKFFLICGKAIMNDGKKKQIDP
jgi:predicted nucleic-acid-binding Zn-ribbon protein